MKFPNSFSFSAFNENYTVSTRRPDAMLSEQKLQTRRDNEQNLPPATSVKILAGVIKIKKTSRQVSLENVARAANQDRTRQASASPKASASPDERLRAVLDRWLLEVGDNDDQYAVRISAIQTLRQNSELSDTGEGGLQLTVHEGAHLSPQFEAVLTTGSINVVRISNKTAGARATSSSADQSRSQAGAAQSMSLENRLRAVFDRWLLEVGEQEELYAARLNAIVDLLPHIELSEANEDGLRLTVHRDAALSPEFKAALERLGVDVVRNFTTSSFGASDSGAGQSTPQAGADRTRYQQRTQEPIDNLSDSRKTFTRAVELLGLTLDEKALRRMNKDQARMLISMAFRRESRMHHPDIINRQSISESEKARHAAIQTSLSEAATHLRDELKLN